MPDLQIIEKHLASYISDLENLKKHQKVTIDEIKSNKDLLWILERGIYILIQNLFDILAHIAAADFKEKWEYYTDIGDIFEKHNIISTEENNILKKNGGL